MTEDLGRPDPDIAAEEEAAAAAREAAQIGGPNPEPDVDPAQRPLVEGGGGVAEGFELAEEDLRRNATHEERGADPMRDAGEVEPDSDRSGAEYAEADHAGAHGEDPDGE